MRCEAEVEKSTSARDLAAQRRRITTFCDGCGQQIEGTVRRRFCSDVCRQKARRERLHEQAVAARMPEARIAPGGSSETVTTPAFAPDVAVEERRGELSAKVASADARSTPLRAPRLRLGAGYPLGPSLAPPPAPVPTPNEESDAAILHDLVHRTARLTDELATIRQLAETLLRRSQERL